MSVRMVTEEQLALAEDAERLRTENETLRRERDEARAAVADVVNEWKAANGYNDLLVAYAELVRERDEARAAWQATETMRQDTALRLEECARQHAEARAATAEATVWVQKQVDAALVSERQARLATEAKANALWEALRGLVSSVSAHLARGEDTTPGDFERAWKEAHTALALPPGDALRALGDRLRAGVVALRVDSEQSDSGKWNALCSVLDLIDNVLGKAGE